MGGQQGRARHRRNSALHRGDAHGFYERRQYVRTGYRFVKQLNDAGLAHGRPE